MTNSRRRNYEVFALEDARPFMGNVTSDEGLRNDLKFFGRSFPLLLEDLLRLSRRIRSMKSRNYILYRPYKYDFDFDIK